MNQPNYQKELDRLLTRLEGRPRLLIHSCCAPCSSYVLEYLREYFDITVLYYNPNITDAQEYEKRLEEQGRLIDRMNLQPDGQQSVQPDGHRRPPIRLERGGYEPALFYEAARGLEKVPEGGERCFRCYELRLRETARLAAAEGYDYFTTTLTISPLKNAHKLNEIGNRLAQETGTAFLPSDFKKKNGYKRSVELSEQYGLYRQDYCGCVFSKREREENRKNARQGALEWE